MDINLIRTNIIPYSQFHYWFIWHRPTSNYTVYDIRSRFKPIGAMSYESKTLIDVLPEYEDDDIEWIRNDYERYIESRPEAYLGHSASICSADDPDHITKNAATYVTYLIGAVLEDQFIRNKHTDPDDAFPTRCLEWLDQTDFFTAPASSKYHEPYPGGLCVHSLKVLNEATDLLNLPKFIHQLTCVTTRIALVHDWCKINRYEPYMRNVKNEQTGVWEQVPSYRTKDTGVCFGHGVSSMFMAQQFFRMKMEEVLAIRWHQGRWNVCELEENEFTYANHNYPLCYLIQFADQLACTNY